MEPERCEECGFDGSRLTVADAVTSLRSLGRRWREVFDRASDEARRQRPGPGVWSALEYAAHTRDVLELIGRGMAQILDGGHPSFDPVEPDEAATDRGYNSLDPEAVLAELASNAGRVADRAEGALPEQWTRTASMGGSEVDAGWVLRHAVHDATHHLRDVERGLARMS